MDRKWTKSSRSNATADCVEWLFTETGVLLRDSKNPQTPPLEFTLSEWAAFLYAVRRGEADHARIVRGVGTPNVRP